MLRRLKIAKIPTLAPSGKLSIYGPSSFEDKCFSSVSETSSKLAVRMIVEWSLSIQKRPQRRQTWQKEIVSFSISLLLSQH